ncbi:MAG: hypothetical protein J6K20_13210 [Thermoguttaceae bacterium]|nr:hypothetical protein [Thermoguttaceae bacterium]
MVSRRLFGRARAISRSLVSSCCAVAVLSGAAFAQQFAPPAEAENFDARLTRFLSGDDSTVATQTDGARFARPSVASQTPVAQPVKSSVAQASAVRAVKPTSVEKSPIRQTSATFQSVKPSPIRQAQYAAAPTADATAQLANPLGGTDAPYVDECPDPNDMPSILDVPYKIVPKPGLFPERCPLPDDDYVRKAPTPIEFTWKASSLCYKPLYFEDVQLERHGHYCHPLLVPFTARARFLLTIPVLPYLMGVYPPNECIYDLGHYRPGDCAPNILNPVPISLRGGLIQAGAVVGAAAIIP